MSRAAAGDPAQAEIHEHLGDALYTAGRRIEARFSWQAALVTAEEQAKYAARAQDRSRADHGQRRALMRLSEPAPAKLNLALHVRGRLPDGRHALETMFAFCTDGDRLEAEAADELSPGGQPGRSPKAFRPRTIWCMRAAEALREAAGVNGGAHA